MLRRAGSQRHARGIQKTAGTMVRSTAVTTRPRTALITGITGQDGRLLARLLLSKGYTVAGLVHPSVKQQVQPAADLAGVRLLRGDLADYESIRRAAQTVQPDEIYNLASLSAPGASWKRPVETGQINGLGAQRVFEAARTELRTCRVFQASSSDMFGSPASSPQNEQTPFAPTNPYAVAKVYAHQSAQIYRNAHDVFIACGILFNHESPLRGTQFITQKVALGAAYAKLGVTDSRETNEEGEPIVRSAKLALGNLDAARDWGYAPDYVDAMWRMLQHESPDDFVVGTGERHTVRQLCEVAYAHVGLDWQDHVITDPRFVRPVDTFEIVADASKAQRILGWTPSRRFASIVADMVEHNLERLKTFAQGTS
jgi:GDPmannose 4,6-dehydratase